MMSEAQIIEKRKGHRGQNEVIVLNAGFRPELVSIRCNILSPDQGSPH